jgi:cell division protein FtsB
MGAIMRWFLSLFEHSVKLASAATVLAFVGLLTQGTLLDLWNLKSDQRKLEKRYRETLKYNEIIRSKIEQARTSDKYIGRQAREKLDLVKEDELVFIFENEPTSTSVTPTQKL